jgi:hypothetical protein
MFNPSVDLAPATARTAVTQRIAIVSTPRNGNTWLRHLLSNAYGIEEKAVHSPLDLDWTSLSEGCVLQIHWHPEWRFLRRLQRERFQPVVLARHPLDVLISILHYSLHEPTARWLEGEGGNERLIFGAMPRSTAFLNYARGPRAAALLSVTREWWNVADVIPVHYEVLNRDPAGELQRVLDALGHPPARAVEEVIADHSITKLRVLTQNDHHFWIGQCGLWKQLLTAAEVGLLAEVLQPLYGDFDYDWEADPNLTAAQADANWIKLVWADVTEDLHNLRQTKQSLRRAQAELAKHQQAWAVDQANLNQAQTDLAHFKKLHEALHDTWRQTMNDYLETRERLVPFLELGPTATAVAFQLHRLSRAHPRLARWVKWLIGRW